jgi:hypothetical protein
MRRPVSSGMRKLPVIDALEAPETRRPAMGKLITTMMTGD